MPIMKLKGFIWVKRTKACKCTHNCAPVPYAYFELVQDGVKSQHSTSVYLHQLVVLLRSNSENMCAQNCAPVPYAYLELVQDGVKSQHSTSVHVRQMILAAQDQSCEYSRWCQVILSRLITYNGTSKCLGCLAKSWWACTDGYGGPPKW